MKDHLSQVPAAADPVAVVIPTVKVRHAAAGDDDAGAGS